MDYKEIINDVGKYHYLVVHNKKVLLLSSNNNHALAKVKALNKIKKHLSFFAKKNIIRIKIKKVNTKLYKERKKTAIITISGPIIVDINVYRISSKGKLKMEDNEDRNDVLFITKKYLKQYKRIKTTHLKQIAISAIRRKLSKTYMSINKIDNIIKID